MNFTHIRNKVKMLLTEQKMLILQFFVLIFFTIFTVLRIYKRFFFYSIYNMYKVWVLLSCVSVVFWVNVIVVNRRGGGGSSIGMVSE